MASVTGPDQLHTVPRRWFRAVARSTAGHGVGRLALAHRLRGRRGCRAASRDEEAGCGVDVPNRYYNMFHMRTVRLDRPRGVGLGPYIMVRVAGADD